MVLVVNGSLQPGRLPFDHAAMAPSIPHSGGAYSNSSDFPRLLSSILFMFLASGSLSFPHYFAIMAQMFLFFWVSGILLCSQYYH